MTNSPDFGEDSPNLSFDSKVNKKRQQGQVLGGLETVSWFGHGQPLVSSTEG